MLRIAPYVRYLEATSRYVPAVFFYIKVYCGAGIWQVVYWVRVRTTELSFELRQRSLQTLRRASIANSL